MVYIARLLILVNSFVLFEGRDDLISFPQIEFVQGLLLKAAIIYLAGSRVAWRDKVRGGAVRRHNIIQLIVSRYGQLYSLLFFSLILGQH